MNNPPPPQKKKSSQLPGHFFRGRISGNMMAAASVSDTQSVNIQQIFRKFSCEGSIYAVHSGTSSLAAGQLMFRSVALRMNRKGIF